MAANAPRDAKTYSERVGAYRISEVAARTGFSPSALRYYEDLGLLRPGRNRSGYRVYDDPSVERLRFVGRAKQLGLNLDEIGGLLALWDGDRCAPVAQRLRTLLGAKLSETRARIADLAAFAAQLHAVAAELDADAGNDRPCGAGCACNASAALLPPVPLAGAAGHGGVPVVCTLEADAVPERLDAWQQVLDQAVARSAIDGGVRVRFPAGAEIAAEVAGLAAAEAACCAFFEFTVHVRVDGVDLDVRAPEAAPLVTTLFGVAS